MANESNQQQGRQPWEARVREAAAQVESDLRKLVTYINDDVMPDVRRNSSSALRSAASEFEKLARRMDETDESNRNPPPPTGNQT